MNSKIQLIGLLALGLLGAAVGTSGYFDGTISYCHQGQCDVVPEWVQVNRAAKVTHRAGNQGIKFLGALIGTAAFTGATMLARSLAKGEKLTDAKNAIAFELELRKAGIKAQADLEGYINQAMLDAAEQSYAITSDYYEVEPEQQPLLEGNTLDQAINPGDKVESAEVRPILESVQPVVESAAVAHNHQLGDAIAQTLGSFGVKCKCVGEMNGPAFTRVLIRPEEGVGTNAIAAKANDLQVQLSFPAAPLISIQPGAVAVDVAHKEGDRQTVKFSDHIQLGKGSEKLTLPIGVNLQGKLIEADLSDPNTCHFLVGGTSGSGKSEWLRQVVFSLVVRYSPEQIAISLIDPKRVTFPEFEEIPWLYSSVCKDSESAINLMEELSEEMEQRYKMFESARVKDIQEFIQANELLPRIVCIFDEYADFMADKEVKEKLEGYIKRLGAKARAAGIHLILSTQRPDAKDVVTPIVRANLPGRVALKTVDEANSKIIIEDELGAKLLGKGDLLYRAASPLQRLQALYVCPSEIKSFLANSTCSEGTESAPITAISTSVAIGRLNQLVETSADTFIAGLGKHYQVIVEYACTRNDWITASDARNGRNHLKQFSSAQIQQFFSDLGGWGVGESQGGKYRYSSTQST